MIFQAFCTKLTAVREFHSFNGSRSWLAKISIFIDLGMKCESVFWWTKIHCQNAETLILKLFVTLNLILAPNTLIWMIKRLRGPVDLSVDFEHLFIMYILLILVLCQILCLILYQFTLTLFQNKQIEMRATQLAIL